MTELMASGRLVDGILILMLIEGCAWLWFRRSLEPTALGGFLVNLAAGMSLLLALRGALTHAGWPTLVFWLSVAFPLHVLDVVLRLSVLANDSCTVLVTADRTLCLVARSMGIKV